MKKIDFKVAGKKYEYNVPENWDEMNQEQFRAFVDSKTFGIDMVRRVMGMDDVVAINLTMSDWWFICREFEWMNVTEDIGGLYVEKITLPDGTVCYGYNPDFSDVTWEEWMFADTYATKGRWDVVAAVLYRPERKEWDKETDRRIPFSKYGAAERMKLAAKLDPLTLRCIQVNYLLLRKRMTDHFYHIFMENVEEKEGEGKKSRKQQQAATDWLKIIRSMMGDNFYEEEKYYKLSVPSVLFQLESRVRESKKHGK